MDLDLERRKLITRRHFFGRTATGIGTAALASLMSPSLFSTASAATEGVGEVAGGLPATHGILKALHFAPKAKRVIYLFMSGGPSHIDLFDYKPALKKLHGTELPAEIRNGPAHHGDDQRAEVVPGAWRRCSSFAQHGQCGRVGERTASAHRRRSWTTSRSSSR